MNTWEKFCKVYGVKMFGCPNKKIYVNGKIMGPDDFPLLSDIVRVFYYCMKNGNTYKMVINLQR